jgi:hypothetical protein
MLVFFSARRLKGDQWDEFRNAWAGGTDGAPEGLPAGSVVYHAKNIKDENEVISFGIFDVDRDSLDVVRGSEEDELKRQEEIAKYVHDVPLEGVYEVVEELHP